ncbi:hypothetical protein BH787_gp47 [Gordonia phage GMA4]|uniref:hypothetical protein n=1 Tax=Gordonia phage GMA4 TaxID=1647471 RepID=UPI0006BD0594|nr:hypothetical protein BH787_gp47 [Gordonia phage GMA4]AKJ72301.1 hypothetical protein GMA4_26 [Gordonia phage GMA4]
MARLGVVMVILGGLILVGFPGAVKDPDQQYAAAPYAGAIVLLLAIVAGAILIRKHRDPSKKPPYILWAVGAVLLVLGLVLSAVQDPSEGGLDASNARDDASTSATAPAALPSESTSPAPQTSAEQVSTAPSVSFSPEELRDINEDSFIDTVNVAGISVQSGRAGMIRLGYKICAYLDRGHDRVEAVESMLRTNPTWTASGAAAVVGAATGTLCPEHDDGS